MRETEQCEKLTTSKNVISKLPTKMVLFLISPDFAPGGNRDRSLIHRLRPLVCPADISFLIKMALLS